MSGGSVPGSGHHDTVPRTWMPGAFVIRKAAVQKYGSGALSRLAMASPTSRSVGALLLGGTGSTGSDPNDKPSRPKKNREAFEALKMIDLGLQGMNEYTSWLQWNYGASVSLDMRSKTMDNYGKQAQQDRRTLEDFIGRKTLTGNERQNLERIKQTWRQAMAQPLLWGKDLERELIDYMEQNQGDFTGAVVGEIRHRPGDAHPGRVRREPAGSRPLRRWLLRSHQQPERSGAGTGRACAGGHSGLCLGWSGAARKPQPATSLVARRYAHPHRARGTVLGTTEGQRHRRCARRSATAATAGRRRARTA